jgi:hypothetical protein
MLIIIKKVRRHWGLEKTNLKQKEGYKQVDLGPVCLLEVVSFWKVNSGKVNYFLMFGSVMENKLENIF